MIITITDHYADAIEALAGSRSDTTDLHSRVLADRCSQPNALVVVPREVMNEMLVQLAKAGHVTITDGAI